LQLQNALRPRYDRNPLCGMKEHLRAIMPVTRQCR
jgi:hypothetical protein